MQFLLLILSYVRKYTSLWEYIGEKSTRYQIIARIFEKSCLPALNERKFPCGL